MKNINGDNPGNFINRLLYFYQCLRDHRKGSNYPCEIFKPSLLKLDIDTFAKTPTRLLCNAFWNSINYKNLKKKIESDFNFFDIGCGSGSYGGFFKKLAGENFSSYTGLDIYKNSNYPKEFNHIISKAEKIYQYIEKKTNFVISQSALEHIEKDVYVIEETTRKLIENNKPFIQIHMVPASKCLWLNLWHGYRQYSKKNLSQILHNFKKKFNLNALIVPIGGNYSYWTQLRYITIPVYFTKLIFKNKQFAWQKQKNVEKKIIESVSKELDCKQENPLFWAIIITSKNINIENSFFKKKS